MRLAVRARLLALGRTDADADPASPPPSWGPLQASPQCLERGERRLAGLGRGNADSDDSRRNSLSPFMEADVSTLLEAIDLAGLEWG